jgi:uncharacterized membrane protein YczE
MKPKITFLIGLLIAAAGIFFALQGAGVVRWPAESFMVGTRNWIEYGIAIAMIGAGFMLAARRMKQG